MTNLARASILTLLALTATAAAGADPVYPLTCQAGPSLKLSLQTWEQHTNVWIEFARAAQPVGPGSPRAGECAWADRGMSADEPVTASGTFEGVGVTVDLLGDGRLEKVRYGGPNLDNLRSLKNLVDRVRAGQSVVLYVRAVGSGRSRHFEITRVGS
jgi:hypothetical protein